MPRHGRRVGPEPHREVRVIVATTAQPSLRLGRRVFDSSVLVPVEEPRRQDAALVDSLTNLLAFLDCGSTAS
eukprot:6067654-Pyramimonas_sp.AAC.1